MLMGFLCMCSMCLMRMAVVMMATAPAKYKVVLLWCDSGDHLNAAGSLNDRVGTLLHELGSSGML